MSAGRHAVVRDRVGESRQAGIGAVLGVVSAVVWALVASGLYGFLRDLVRHGGSTGTPALLWLAVLVAAWLCLASSVVWVPLVIGGFGLAVLRCVGALGIVGTAAGFAAAVLVGYAVLLR